MPGVIGLGGGVLGGAVGGLAGAAPGDVGISLTAYWKGNGTIFAPGSGTSHAFDDGNWGISGGDINQILPAAGTINPYVTDVLSVSAVTATFDPLPANAYDMTIHPFRFSGTTISFTNGDSTVGNVLNIFFSTTGSGSTLSISNLATLSCYDFYLLGKGTFDVAGPLTVTRFASVDLMAVIFHVDDVTAVQIISHNFVADQFNFAVTYDGAGSPLDSYILVDCASGLVAVGNGGLYVTPFGATWPTASFGGKTYHSMPSPLPTDWRGLAAQSQRFKLIRNIDFVGGQSAFNPSFTVDQIKAGVSLSDVATVVNNYRSEAAGVVALRNIPEAAHEPGSFTWQFVSGGFVTFDPDTWDIIYTNPNAIPFGLEIMTLVINDNNDATVLGNFSVPCTISFT